MITFIGGASSVTGSAYHLQALETSILIDCGAEQGEGVDTKSAHDRMKILPDADYCVLTHAHYDHCGLLPLAVKSGKIRKRIISTPATRDLAELILFDSVRIQMEEGVPLYSGEDVRRTMLLWDVVDCRQTMQLADAKVTLYSSSHIIGSASVHVKCGGHSYLFSSDLGTGLQKVLDYPPDIPPSGANFLIVESTYGDKLHNSGDRSRLLDIINETCGKGGRVLIPVFAIGRLQELLYAVKSVSSTWNVYVDTPLGQKVTHLQRQYSEYLEKSIRKQVLEEGAQDVFGKFTFVNSARQSAELAALNDPCIILSSSGMVEAGRVLTHFNYIKERADSSIIFVGYQGAGSRGRAVLDGKLPVKCRVERLSSFSSHADQGELVDYINRLVRKPDTIYLTHGEDRQRRALRNRLEKLGIEVVLPLNNSVMPLAIRNEPTKGMANDLTASERGLFPSFGIDVDMTTDEFSANVDSLVSSKVFSSKLIVDFVHTLLKVGPTAATQYVRIKHEKNSNTGRRRWNTSNWDMSPEEEEKLYERAYFTLLKAVDMAMKHGTDRVVEAFSHHVKHI